MPPLFRKRQTAQTADPVDDEIPADLIASLPEVDTAKEDTPTFDVVQGPSAEDWRPIPLPPPSRAAAAPKRDEPAAASLLADVRRQMEQVFERELGKVEDSFTSTLRQLEGRLDRANAEVDALRRENETLQRQKAEYERKAEALRELARSFEK